MIVYHNQVWKSNLPNYVFTYLCIYACHPISTKLCSNALLYKSKHVSIVVNSYRLKYIHMLLKLYLCIYAFTYKYECGHEQIFKLSNIAVCAYVKP